MTEWGPHVSFWPVFLPTLSSICPDNLSHLSDKRRSWSGNQISTFHIICSCVIINHNGTRFLLYIMKTECCGKKCIHSWKWLQPWWAPPWWLSGGHCARTQPCKILAQFNPCCAPSHRAARASAQGRFVSFIINCSLRWTKTERWNTDEQLQEGGKWQKKAKLKINVGHGKQIKLRQHNNMTGRRLETNNWMGNKDERVEEEKSRNNIENMMSVFADDDEEEDGIFNSYSNQFLKSVVL